MASCCFPSKHPPLFFRNPQVQLSCHFSRSGCRFLCSFLWRGETGTKKNGSASRVVKGLFFPATVKGDFVNSGSFVNSPDFCFVVVICSCQEGYHTVGDLREDGEEVLFHRSDCCVLCQLKVRIVIPFSYCLSFMWSLLQGWSTYPGPWN